MELIITCLFVNDRRTHIQTLGSTSLGDVEKMLADRFFLQIAVGEVQRAHDRPPVQRHMTDGNPVFLATDKQQVPRPVDNDPARSHLDYISKRFGHRLRRRRLHVVQLHVGSVEEGLQFEQVTRRPPPIVDLGSIQPSPIDVGQFGINFGGCEDKQKSSDPPVRNNKQHT
jgi:hypothetical protein